LDELQKSANVNAVFGQPVQVGEKTVIPIASVQYGFGLGSVSKKSRLARPVSEEGWRGAVAKPLGLAEIHRRARASKRL